MFEIQLVLSVLVGAGWPQEGGWQQQVISSVSSYHTHSHGASPSPAVPGIQVSCQPVRVTAVQYIIRQQAGIRFTNCHQSPLPLTSEGEVFVLQKFCNLNRTSWTNRIEKAEKS